MTIRQTVPTVTKLTNQTVLTGANDEVLKFTVTADSAGDVELKRLTITFNRALAATEQTIRLFEGVTEIDTTNVAANAKVGTFDITGRTERNIAAGASRTFTVKANSTGTGALVASIAADAVNDTGTAIDFAWRDGAVATDINGYLVEALPITGDTLIQP